jgi:nucleotide-binding universal stress UspA family protein
MSHQIVVGVDGSPHSIAALRWALEEAAERSDEVTAVLCWQLPSVPGAFDRDELERGYQELLVSTVSRAAPAPRVSLRTLTTQADPVQGLVTAAKDARLLVLGARSRSPVAGLMLGSVSQACAAAAACPVVLVKDTGNTGSPGSPA